MDDIHMLSDQSSRRKNSYHRLFDVAEVSVTFRRSIPDHNTALCAQNSKTSLPVNLPIVVQDLVDLGTEDMRPLIGLGAQERLKHAHDSGSFSSSAELARL